MSQEENQLTSALGDYIKLENLISSADIEKCLEEVSIDKRYAIVRQVRDRFDNTSLWWAVYRDDIKTVKVILSALESDHLYKLLMLKRNNIFHKLASSGNLELVKKIVRSITQDQKHILIIRKDMEGNSPIISAVSNGHTEIVSYLLGVLNNLQRFDLLKLKNKQGNTALHMAVCKRHVGTLKVMLDSITPIQRYRILTSTGKYDDAVLSEASRMYRDNCISTRRRSFYRRD